ncbi:acyltransferase family protein [Muricoccus pecuniae]|uniref:Peptidoglycan/LPS O-acetylase OafA/YrhL n=1 Tax=Muricoccus pecuniae TaxID=693023 RepID=A0A840Y3Q8_9PROT|nr:acyltransferase [Roseomonas pecuniae]MBB5694340.1 peptidoglycan/LPS O-acetylase OafA/YrhL [Roseomonas pecuniae]
MAERGHRVAFADQLRGIAALLVLLSHHAGIFWHAHPVVAEITGLPPAFSVPPESTGFLVPLVSGTFQFGSAGVALFFLISGYVIPYSLRGRTRGSFALARLLRLLPTYWVGFSIQLSVLVAAQSLMGGHFPRSAVEVAFNLMPGLHLLVWSPSLDGILWTLDIEMAFYLLAALAAPALLARSAGVLAIPAVMGLAGAVLTLFPGWTTQPVSPFFGLFTGLAIAAPMILFMSVGTVLHLAEQDVRWRRPALLLVPVLLLAFSILLVWWPRGSMAAQVPSYLIMAALFTAAFLLRARIPAWTWPTRLASISYSLYVVHGVSGYAIMIVLSRYGLSPLALFTAAVAWSFGAALLLHRFVEEPTRRLSSRLGRQGHAPAAAETGAP